MENDLLLKLYNTVQDMEQAKQYDTTYWIPLGNYFGNDWAIVFGWQDPYENGYLSIMGKVAYQNPNCIMQEYEMDWQMPYDAESGEVDDTEIILVGNGLSDLEWLVSQWKRIQKEMEEAA